MAVTSASKIEGLKELQDTLNEYRENGLLELEQYRAIGTVEECRKALEKQTPKKVMNMKMFPTNCGEIHITNFSGKCPSCDHTLIKSMDAHKICPYCLQALEWSE